MDSIFADVNVFMRRHKSAHFHMQFRSLLIIVYLHSDVSYRFNGEDDNIQLECKIMLFDSIYQFGTCLLLPVQLQVKLPSVFVQTPLLYGIPVAHSLTAAKKK